MFKVICYPSYSKPFCSRLKSYCSTEEYHWKVDFGDAVYRKETLSCLNASPIVPRPAEVECITLWFSNRPLSSNEDRRVLYGGGVFEDARLYQSIHRISTIQLRRLIMEFHLMLYQNLSESRVWSGIYPYTCWWLASIS